MMFKTEKFSSIVFNIQGVSETDVVTSICVLSLMGDDRWPNARSYIRPWPNKDFFEIFFYIQNLGLYKLFLEHTNSAKFLCHIIFALKSTFSRSKAYQFTDQMEK